MVFKREKRSLNLPRSGTSYFSFAVTFLHVSEQLRAGKPPGFLQRRPPRRARARVVVHSCLGARVPPRGARRLLPEFWTMDNATGSAPVSVSEHRACKTLSGGCTEA